MIRLRHKLFLQFLRILDLLILITILILAVWLIPDQRDPKFLMQLRDFKFSLPQISGGLGLLAGWFFILGLFIKYESNRFASTLGQIRSIVIAVTACTMLLIFVAAIGSYERLTISVAAAFWGGGIVVFSVTRFILFKVLTLMRRSGRNSRYLLIIGTDDHAVHLASRIDARSELGCRLVGLYAENDESFEKAIDNITRWPVLGSLKDIREFLERGTIDEVLVCLPLKAHFNEVYEIIRLCRSLGLVVRLVPQTYDLKMLSQAQVELFEGEHLVTFFRENLLWQLLAKRLLDVVVSASMLLVLSPLLIAVALIIKFTSTGPVFFIQQRVGMNRRKFPMYKFRSMVVNAEELKQKLAAQNEMDGPVFKMKNDPRITPIGRFIRKTSIDELPQLWNVLHGDMSLVGPRPPIPGEVAQYFINDHRRLSIKPGLTCLWQISGRNNISFEQWMEMDREYIENWSFWLDIKILAKTVPVVLLGKGAS